MSVTALIVAAGSGQRLGAGLPKQYRALAGKPVLRHAVEALAAHEQVDAVRVVIGPDQQSLAREALGSLDVGALITGGAERADSVRQGLAEINPEGIVLVHDAARPFCPPEVVDRLISALGEHQGAVPVLEVRDTLARASTVLGQAIDREGAVRVQTPQAFRAEALQSSYRRWHGPSPTDEATVVRAAGFAVAAVQGSELLDKLTDAEDWVRAEQRLASSLVPRTGSGFDVHAFGGAGPVMMGGIAIPHARGLLGHSDADVVLHSLTDALLGAAGLGDIGEHFPPTDERWKGAASDQFLRHAAALITARGGTIDHVDCTVIAEEPKVGPHRSAMRSSVARILGVPVDRVSIKATTTEGLGFTGRREGIAAQAIASIRMPEPR